MQYEDDKILISSLEWDTNFFGLSSAKVVLKKEISKEDIVFIKDQINILNAKFITITNLNNNEHNNHILKDIDNIFLADVNIRFQKMLLGENTGRNHTGKIKITNNLIPDSDILDIAEQVFVYSRFNNDPNLPNNKKDIYKEWTSNAFKKEDKYFCCYSENDKTLGFILFNIKDFVKTSTIELIGVAPKSKSSGIGKNMMCEMEDFLVSKGIEFINVGTQINNITAQNFYIKCGYIHINNNAIYHWWK